MQTHWFFVANNLLLAGFAIRLGARLVPAGDGLRTLTATLVLFPVLAVITNLSLSLAGGVTALRIAIVLLAALGIEFALSKRWPARAAHAERPEPIRPNIPQLLAAGLLGGAMLGRAAYERPATLAAIDRRLYGAASDVAATDAVVAMIRYAERQCANGTPLGRITRHMLGLFHGAAGARAWRRTRG